jgi:hypothetical protein
MSLAITREMLADLWYEQPEQDETWLDAPPPDLSTLIASRNGNSPEARSPS